MPDLYCAYARNSHRENLASVEQQVTEFRAYSEARGLALYEPVFEDRSRSGTTDEGRKGIENLMEFLARRPRPVKGVLLWASSRMARNVDDSAWYKASIRRLGYKIVYVGDDMLNVEGPMRHVFESLVEYKDEQFSLDLARDVRRGMMTRLTAGHAVGKPARGYRLVVDPLDGEGRTRMDVDPLYAPRIALAFEMRAAGHSLADIHEKTNIYPNSVSYSRMFNNKIYLGIMEWGEEQYPGYCEPIVSQEVWDRAQVVNNRAREHPRRARSEYLLSGRVYCGECGAKLRVKVSNSQRKSGSAVKYSYYSCIRDFSSGCGAVHIRTDGLDDWAAGRVGETFTPEVIGPRYAALMAQEGRVSDERDLLAESLKIQLLEVNTALDHLNAAIEQGAGFASVAERLAKREGEKAEIEKKLSALPPPRLYLATRYDLDELCADVQERLKSDDLAERRLAMRALVERVDVYAGGREPDIVVRPLRL
jgi:site-specific DNA recombinase